MVQNFNFEFAESMRLRGHKRRIVDDQAENSKPGENPTTVSRRSYIEEIRQILNITRGCELPGMFNPLIVGDLFREQSGPWENLAREHLETIGKLRDLS